MIKPVRIQLSRRKGFNLQATSRSINGLSAINCTRPSPWGNQFVIGRDAATASACVDLYVNSFIAVSHPLFYRAALHELPGHNLACACDLFAPCHVDVLLDIFGRIECREVA